MQDRYAGDVGDFGKLGMLRQIAATGLKIGINWYFTSKLEEHGNADGKHVSYLENKSFRYCDDELLSVLRGIVDGNRSVAAIERATLIPNAQYFSAPLKPISKPTPSREMWLNNSIEALAEADIIFCDPDNGLLVKTVSLGSTKVDKYVAESDLVSYYLTGKSIIFYNHRSREKIQMYLKRFESLKRQNELNGAKWKGLTFRRGSTRDYIFILQPKHFEQINGAIEMMMQGNWKKHFTYLQID